MHRHCIPMSLRTFFLLSAVVTGAMVPAFLSLASDENRLEQGQEKLLQDYLRREFEVEAGRAKVKRLDTVILECPVYIVEIFGRIPRYQLVLIDAKGGMFMPSLADKQPAASWSRVAELVVRRCLPRGFSKDQSVGLAEDFTRLFVDPDVEYGRLLHSVDDIPINMNSSDRLRDLRRHRLSEVEIKKLLLADVPSICAPTCKSCDQGHDGNLDFFTWGYFGGEVVRWSIDLKNPMKSEFEVLATRRGSFDYYF